MTSHYGEPFNLLHLPMFCTSYFSSFISLSLSSTIQIAHVLELKNEEEKTVPVEAKDRENDNDTSLEGEKRDVIYA